MYTTLRISIFTAALLAPLTGLAQAETTQSKTAQEQETVSVTPTPDGKTFKTVIHTDLIMPEVAVIVTRSPTDLTLETALQESFVPRITRSVDSPAF